MIFDRTQNDVDNAVRIRSEKVQKFEALTEEDINTLEKGLVTINTLNRVEEKQIELKNLLNDIGYFNTNITNKIWSATQIFALADLERIFSNAEVLREAFFVYKDTPSAPEVKYHYQNFNDLEKILHDLDVMINDVKAYYRECGTFECGEENTN